MHWQPQEARNPKPAPDPLPASKATPTQKRRGPEAGFDRTQRITLGDINRGIIRIPRAAKGLFPPKPTRVDINLRGQAKVEMSRIGG